MGIFRIFGIVVVTFVILAFSWWAYMGGFSRPSIMQTKSPAVEIIYTTHTGPYEKIGKTWRQFDKALAQAGLADCAGLGVYLDPPGTPKEQLRSVLGCRIDALSEYQKSTLRSVFPSFTIPMSEGISAHFPYRNEMSFPIASMKIYPVMGEYATQNSVEAPLAIEYYNDDRIVIYLPVSLERAVFTPLEASF